MDINTAYQTLYGATLVVLSVFIGIMLIRAIIGPRITDRIMSINMIGTMVICCIMILSRMLNENYLVDVALIYSMLSFVAVLIVTVTYLPAKTKAPKLDELEPADRQTTLHMTESKEERA